MTQKRNIVFVAIFSSLSLGINHAPLISYHIISYHTTSYHFSLPWKNESKFQKSLGRKNACRPAIRTGLVANSVLLLLSLIPLLGGFFSVVVRDEKAVAVWGYGEMVCVCVCVWKLVVVCDGEVVLLGLLLSFPLFLSSFPFAFVFRFLCFPFPFSFPSSLFPFPFPFPPSHVIKKHRAGTRSGIPSIPPFIFFSISFLPSLHFPIVFPFLLPFPYFLSFSPSSYSRLPSILSLSFARFLLFFPRLCWDGG